MSAEWMKLQGLCRPSHQHGNPPWRCTAVPRRHGQTVNLIDKEHLAGVQRTQNRSQITSMLDGGTGSDADWNFQFIGHNHGQSGFAKSRRPRKQDIVRRNVTFSSSIEEKLQLRFEPWLSDESLDMRTKLLVADQVRCRQGAAENPYGGMPQLSPRCSAVRMYQCSS